MSTRPVRLTATIILAAALTTLGCASPPGAEKKAAEQAVSAARTAGAEKYASTEFAAAADALKAAEGQMGARKYVEAKTTYVMAKELAERAAKAVETGKAVMKSQVEQQLRDAEERWLELEGKAKVGAKKFKAEQKQAWAAAATSISESLQAARATAGDDPASAKEKLDAVVPVLDKWESELKALSAPGKKAGKK
jgi:hypothetical protein